MQAKNLTIRHIPCIQPLCDAFPRDAVIFVSKIVILAALVALVQTLCDTFPLHAVFFVLLSVCTKIPLTLSVVFVSKIVIWAALVDFSKVDPYQITLTGQDFVLHFSVTCCIFRTTLYLHKNTTNAHSRTNHPVSDPVISASLSRTLKPQNEG